MWERLGKIQSAVSQRHHPTFGAAYILDQTRFSSGPPALLKPSTNSVLLSLCSSQFAMLPSYNSLCSSRQCCLSGHFAPLQQRSVQLQIVLFIRSLCSLPTTVCNIVRNIVCQVTVLPSFTVNLHCCKATVSLQIVCQVTLFPSFTGNLHCCKSGRSAPFLQQ